MRLKCLLLKLLLCSLSLLREGWGELGKESNRKTPGRFLTKMRDDYIKIYVKTRGTVNKIFTKTRGNRKKVYENEGYCKKNFYESKDKANYFLFVI